MLSVLLCWLRSITSVPSTVLYCTALCLNSPHPSLHTPLSPSLTLSHSLSLLPPSPHTHTGEGAHAAPARREERAASRRLGSPHSPSSHRVSTHTPCPPSIPSLHSLPSFSLPSSTLPPSTLPSSSWQCVASCHNDYLCYGVFLCDWLTVCLSVSPHCLPHSPLSLSSFLTHSPSSLLTVSLSSPLFLPSPHILRNAYHTLFVARISFDTTEKKLRREFEQYGPVRAVKMINDREDKSRWVTDRQTYLVQTYREALRLIDRQTDRDTGRQKIQTDTERQTDYSRLSSASLPCTVSYHLFRSVLFCSVFLNCSPLPSLHCIV